MTPILRPVSRMDLQPTPVTWLWRPYIGAGKLTLLDGDPGVGKSVLTIDVAARLSRGGPLPGDLPGTPGSSLLLSAEDDPADTVLPRLRAAGADPDRIFVPTAAQRRGLSPLPKGLPQLEDLVRGLGVRLLVLDPLPGFLPAAHAADQLGLVRDVLGPLTELAAGTGAAVLVVRHLSKKSYRRALYQGLGSVGIAGLARTVLLAERHTFAAGRFTLTAVKSNLAAPPPIDYCLRERDGVPAVEWPSEAAPLPEPSLPPPRPETPGVVRATLWLLEALANGARPAAELLAEARAAGIRERTLEFAKRRAKVESKFVYTAEGKRSWLWCPPRAPRRSILEPWPPLDDRPEDLSRDAHGVLERDQLARALESLER